MTTNKNYLEIKRKVGRPAKVEKNIKKDTCETTIFAAENVEGEIL